MKSRIVSMAIICLCAGSVVARAVNCNVVSASLAFGTYDPITSSSDKTVLGNIQINCTGAIAVTIKLAVGNGTFAMRTMSNSGHSVNYNIYADAGHTQVWGDGTSGTVTVPFTFSASGTQTIPVYGKIPKGQTSSIPNTYTATPQVTVSWSGGG